MTRHGTESPGEAQARRLERVYDEVARRLQAPGVAARLRAAPGADEWSAMQTLGHVTEMIPFWLEHCRALIAATGAPPPFGRVPGAPERLAGVARGAAADPEVLLGELEREVRLAATAIRAHSAADRSKQGLHTGRGERMTVAEILESFIVRHAEEHMAQVESSLRG